MHPCVVALAAVLACTAASAASPPASSISSISSDPPALVTPSAAPAPPATGTLSPASPAAASVQPATAACLAASQLQRAKVAGKPVVFDGSVGTTAVLLSGRSARPQMKHLSGRELCLFDRKTGVAHVTDAENMGLARQ